jgi:RND family efflux transporter MFP subunit
MNTRLKMIAAAILLILIIVIIAITRNGDEITATNESSSIPVKTADVEYRDVSRMIHTSGRLRSESEKRLSFKIGGIIDVILVDEGQKVKQGQLLSRLDQLEISSRVYQARTAFKKAKRDMDRVITLYADSVATLEQKQDATTAMEIAEMNLNIAEFNLRHSSIYAPSDGRILKRFVESSELVSPGIPVFLFGATGQNWIVRAGVSDIDIIKIRLGDPADIVFPAYPEHRFKGTVTEIAEAADPVSGTFEVEIELERDEFKLIAGFVAEIDIHPSSRKRMAIIPIEALVEGDGSTGHVYTVNRETSRAIKREVDIAYILENSVAIASGLEDIREVVSNGSSYLTDGADVNIIEVQDN